MRMARTPSTVSIIGWSGRRNAITSTE